MPIRHFTDSDGVEWQAWNVTPAAANYVRPDLRHGWLTFKSSTECRRLAPAPSNWEVASVDRLQLMCRAATPVPDREPEASQVADTGPAK